MQQVLVRLSVAQPQVRELKVLDPLFQRLDTRRDLTRTRPRKPLPMAAKEPPEPFRESPSSRIA